MSIKYKYKVTTIDNLSCGRISTKYKLLYNKDTNVYARAGTLGVMTFKRKKDAKNFIRKSATFHLNKIKRVLPIGRGKVPKFVALLSLERFYEDIELKRYVVGRIGPPAGTICYPGVFVCD